jgi:hypothetical protein
MESQEDVCTAPVLLSQCAWALTNWDKFCRVGWEANGLRKGCGTVVLVLGEGFERDSDEIWRESAALGWGIRMGFGWDS